MPASTSTGPLAGVKVLDLSRLLPGPFCTQLLVDLGARVLKIEDPQGGDYVRHMPPAMADGNSAFFHAVNRGKESVALDLKSDAGRAAFVHLVRWADVVVESFRPGVLARLGLAPEALVVANPRVVVCSISGYGQDRPDRLRAGHDVNYLAKAGVLGMLARPDLPPIQPADFAGGAWPAALQICAALYGRGQHGRGAIIDVSMTDSVQALLAMPAALLAADQAIGHGIDTLVGGAPCYAVYPTKDGHLSVGGIEPKFWRAFCDAAGLDDVRDDAFTTGADGERVRARVIARLREKTTAEWAEIFAGVDACVEPVLTPADAIAARGNTVEVDIAGTRARLLTTALSTTGAAAATTAGPALGAHTDAVLREAGVPDDVRTAAQPST